MAISTPDFFVVGAQKAGTTTLHEWLEQSTEIALPWTKETHFFRDMEKFSKGEEWYFQQFKSLNTQAKVIGEVDPEYMYFPECAERIKSLVKAPKLIFVLRDPVSRARSHYQMSVRRGYEPLSFYDALVAEKDRLDTGERFSRIHHSYIDRGLYFNQMKKMLEKFQGSEVLVLLFEDLFSSQEAATGSLKKICEFIGISHEGLSVDVSVRENRATRPRFIFLRNFIYGQGKIKKQFGKLIPSRRIKIELVKLLDRLNGKAILKNGLEKTAEGSEMPSFVYQAFIDDLRKLQTIVKIDVSHWIEDYEKRLEK